MKLKSKAKDRPEKKLTERPKPPPRLPLKEPRESLNNESKDLKLKLRLKDMPMKNQCEGPSLQLSLPRRGRRKNKL